MTKNPRPPITKKASIKTSSALGKSKTGTKAKVPTVLAREEGASTVSQKSPRTINIAAPREYEEYNQETDHEIDSDSDSSADRSLDDDVDELIEAESETFANQGESSQGYAEPNTPLDSEPIELAETALVRAADTGMSGASDPLRRYYQEVSRYELLSPEEEFKLATHLKATGDLVAAKRLVTANLRLVVKIAIEYRSIYSNLLDLIQEGNVGLMKAVSKFDPTKGARLGYYSSWWIRSYILKYLLDNFRLVKVGTTQAQKKLFYHLLREKERLEAQGLSAGPKLIADKLNVREKDVIEMQQRLSGAGSEVPLDAPVNDEGGKTTHLDLLADTRSDVSETITQDQLISILKRNLPEFEKTLNPKELKLLQERLLSETPKTLQEVADQYGLTRERARQIEARVIVKLREFMKDDLGSDD